MPSFETEVSRLTKQGALEEALALSRQGLCDDSTHLSALVWSALIYRRLGKAHQAYACIHRATDIEKDRAQLWTLRAELLTEIGEPALADKCFRKALHLDPRDPQINHLYLRSLISQGRDREIRTQARIVLSLSRDPKHISVGTQALIGLGETRIGAAWVRERVVEGWAWDRRRLYHPAELIVSGAGFQEAIVANRELPALRPTLITGSAHGFQLDWPDTSDNLAIRFRDGGEILAGCPLRRPPTPGARIPGRLQESDNLTSPIVDVIVPVYRGYDATRQCIGSVIASNPSTPFELVVFNDASPDPRINRYLEGLARTNRIRLFNNRENLGFLRTVNRALALHPERDCVLLNADTLVANDWLDRLRKAAYADESTCTVTPLTNNGEMMSYPVPASSNPLRCASLVLTLDAIAARVNRGQRVETPVGVGFCLYIRRRCLNEIGFLDDTLYERGYGEESDLCLRASASGWHHVCATDVFVGHAGSVSFGEDKRSLVLSNTAILKVRYPGYSPDVKRFIRLDPLRDARQRIEREQIKHLPKGGRLVVCGPEGPNARRLRTHRFRLAAEGTPVYWLHPERTRKGFVLRLTGDAKHVLANQEYEANERPETLISDLRHLELAEIEIHDTASLREQDIELLTSLALPYSVVLHDYSLFCPRRYLLDGTGRYCGEPADIEACERCVDSTGSLLAREVSVYGLRRWASGFLAGATDIRTASVDAATRYRRRFPGLPVSTTLPQSSVPCPTRPSRPPPPFVVFIADDNHSSGFGVLLAMARNAAERDLPLLFVVPNGTIDDSALLATGKAVINRVADTEDVCDLVRTHGCTLALSLSAWPDPDALGVHHARETGLPVAAMDIGAARELMKRGAAQHLLPLYAAAPELNSALLRIVEHNNAV